MPHPFAASRAPDTSTLVFVGRTREQQELRTVLAAALGGHGAIALISGEAGIGKTTLAEAVCREAEVQGGLVLVGRCDDLAATPPYGPWIELFAHYPADVQGLTLPSAFTQPGGVGAVASQATLFIREDGGSGWTRTNDPRLIKTVL